MTITCGTAARICKQSARSIPIGELQVEKDQADVGMPFEQRQRLADVSRLEQLQLGKPWVISSASPSRRGRGRLPAVSSSAKVCKPRCLGADSHIGPVVVAPRPTSERSRLANELALPAIS
jgi:hypothetical protein